MRAPSAATACCRQVLVLNSVVAPGACSRIEDAIASAEAACRGEPLPAPLRELDTAADAGALVGAEGAPVQAFCPGEAAAITAWSVPAHARVFGAPTSLLVRDGQCAAALLLVVHCDSAGAVLGTAPHVALADADSPDPARPVGVGVFVFEAPVGAVAVKQHVAALQSHGGGADAVAALRSMETAWRVALVYAASRGSDEPLLRDVLLAALAAVAAPLHRVLTEALRACSGKESRQMGSYVAQFNRAVGHEEAAERSPKRKRRSKNTGGRPAFTVERYVRLLDDTMRAPREPAADAGRAALVLPFVEELRARHERDYFERCLGLMECAVTWARDAAIASAAPPSGYGE